MNEPQPGQRFDLRASLDDMEVNPEGEFALAADLDAALALLRQWRRTYAKQSNLSRATHDLLVKLGRPVS